MAEMLLCSRWCLHSTCTGGILPVQEVIAILAIPDAKTADLPHHQSLVSRCCFGMRSSRLPRSNIAAVELVFSAGEDLLSISGFSLKPWSPRDPAGNNA